LLEPDDEDEGVDEEEGEDEDDDASDDDECVWLWSPWEWLWSPFPLEPESPLLDDEAEADVEAFLPLDRLSVL
jgi:hypothetical protein